MSEHQPKAYEPAAVEAEAYRVWIEEKAFHPDPTAPGEPYCIVIPPPNVTGALHLGHAINNTLQDILIRSHRMRGFNALWVPGIDHAGIATQAVVEKQLKEKENKTRHDVGREGLIERIWAWKQQYGDRILSQLQRLGCSCDWDRARFTLDDICAKAVRETFFKLFKDGLIYRGKRLVNWDIFLQTSISDDEIYHETVKTSLWHIKYPIEGGGQCMVVATTRPETMLGDTAVAVHSQDPRWNQFIGEKVRLPLSDRLIPIIADDILVDPKFGSGVVKVTPAHDPNDYAVWQRHQGKDDQIDLINILNPDGTINQNGGAYAGLVRDAARKKVVRDLEHQGLLVKEEPYETQVGHSDRSKTPVEPYLSDQWFVKMAPLAEPALQVVRDGTIKFYPERHAQQYLSWLGEKRDWPISRQLWWGHRIPVWNLYLWADNEGSQIIEKLHGYFREIGVEDDVCILTTNSSDHVQICTRSVRADRAMEAMNRYYHVTGTPQIDPSQYADVVQSDQAWAIAESIMNGPAADPVSQDPDVLDTWFSSALWPHSTLGWPEKTAELAKWYPTSVLLTGRDIITLWVARMVMTGIYNMGQVPFHHVAINPTILDGKGERMSKSKGNGVDPVEIIDTHGADALRFTLTSMATETQDVRMPVEKDEQGRNTSPKFDEGRKFCNKLWQVSQHFALANLQRIPPEPVDESKWSLADRWIIGRLGRTVEAADAALGEYRFDQYAKACYDFFWGDFCDWYVETIKPALRDPAKAGQAANVLAAILDGSLRLMHPMIPFITEILWWRLNEVRASRGLEGYIEAPASARLIRAAWPKVKAVDSGAEELFPKLQAIIIAIRNVRNAYKVSPRQTVTVSIAAAGGLIETIVGNRGMIELLGTCKLGDVGIDLKPVADASRASAAGCEIFVQGLVDETAEKQRQAVREQELIKLIATLRGRRDNAGYIAKAPPQLVKQTLDQLAAAEAELAKLRHTFE